MADYRLNGLDGDDQLTKARGSDPAGDSDAIPADLSAELCKSCGLCCSGALFDYVPVDELERPRLTELGFPVRTDPATGMRFDHPCARFKNGLCSVYADRPQACRRFRCELLISVENGRMSADRAHGIVREAKAMVDEVRLLHGDDRPLLPQSWRERLRAWGSGKSAGRADPALLLQMTRLNVFLDRHFRSKAQRVVLDKE